MALGQNAICFLDRKTGAFGQELRQAGADVVFFNPVLPAHLCVGPISFRAGLSLWGVVVREGGGSKNKWGGGGVRMQVQGGYVEGRELSELT